MGSSYPDGFAYPSAIGGANLRYYIANRADPSAPTPFANDGDLGRA